MRSPALLRPLATTAMVGVLAAGCGWSSSAADDPVDGAPSPAGREVDEAATRDDPSQAPAAPAPSPSPGAVEDGGPAGGRGARTARRNAPPGTPTPPPPAQVFDGQGPRPSPSRPRPVNEQAWSPFATVGGITLRHPSSRVERVGFHESNHDGARQLTVLESAIRPLTLETRERDTGSRTAADIVVDPRVEIRAPVTGTVRRAGTYVLYCDHSDDFAVIEPDAHPGWEVKLLHIDGVRVSAGDRVKAGVTVLAGGPTPLPFRSQVDDHTVEPSWPHVHLEVVDPSIPDRPSGGGC